MNTKLTLSGIIGITIAVIVIGALAPAALSSSEEAFHPTYSNGVGNGIEITGSTDITYTYDPTTFTHAYTINDEPKALPGGGDLLVCTDVFVLKAQVASGSGSNFISFNDGAAKNINNVTDLRITLTPTTLTGTYSTTDSTDVALNLAPTWGYAYSGTGDYALVYSSNAEYYYNSVDDVRGFMMSGDLGGTVAVTGDVANFTDYYGESSTLTTTPNSIAAPDELIKIKISTDGGYTITKNTTNVSLTAFVVPAEVQGTVENGNTYSSLVMATIAMMIVAVLIMGVRLITVRSD